MSNGRVGCRFRLQKSLLVGGSTSWSKVESSRSSSEGGSRVRVGGKRGDASGLVSSEGSYSVIKMEYLDSVDGVPIHAKRYTCYESAKEMKLVLPFASLSAVSFTLGLTSS